MHGGMNGVVPTTDKKGKLAAKNRSQGDLRNNQRDKSNFTSAKPPCEVISVISSQTALNHLKPKDVITLALQKDALYFPTSEPLEYGHLTVLESQRQRRGSSTQ